MRVDAYIKTPESKRASERVNKPTNKRTNDRPTDRPTDPTNERMKERTDTGCKCHLVKKATYRTSLGNQWLEYH